MLTEDDAAGLLRIYLRAMICNRLGGGVGGNGVSRCVSGRLIALDHSPSI